MNTPSWLTGLERTQPSYLLLSTLAAIILVAAGLHQIGLIGGALRGLGSMLRHGIRAGFRLWKRLLGWASWPSFLTIAVVFLLVGCVADPYAPSVTILCGMAALFMGTIACLAYIFIDFERNEVERGHKVVHNPRKGQLRATYLERHGKQVQVPLLLSATVAVIGGFALLNQGLYETIGRNWYRVADPPRQPEYADFLAYSLSKILGLMDVLDLAKDRHILGSPVIHQASWQASTLLVGFKLFFTLVLLHQIIASLRRGRLLSETITDFWSPHEPIHERAREALPVYGSVAIVPLLKSLRSVGTLTKEQRDHLPLILENFGPAIIPALVRHLHDPHEYVRSVVAAALGQLNAVEMVPELAALVKDPSDVVRHSVVEALGFLASTRPGSKRTVDRASPFDQGGGLWRLLRLKRRVALPPSRDPVELAVATLASALDDDSAAVRTQAAVALGRVGNAAASVVPRLISLLKEADETVRCEAAKALGDLGGHEEATVVALIDLLQDASPVVKVSAALALGELEKRAAPAVSALVPLLQDGEESVRTAAAEAIARLGPLDQDATETLVEGLESSDTIVRAQTAEALGTIGAAAEEAAPPLVEALDDQNDRVRARAVEALGKIGETVAETAVPGLVKALRDRDNWVSALAAEALGEMGDSADAAIPALVRSLRHDNAEVRSNAAEAIGKMGVTAVGARPALEKAGHDDNGAVRAQAIRALGQMGMPTPTSTEVVLAGLLDPDPLVRVAAVESLGQSYEPSKSSLDSLILLLEDENDQVKVEVTKVLPKLAGATPEVIERLCRRLLEDDSDWVQVYAALALGKLGPAAANAGGPLLRAAQTGEVSVREQAMRAIAMIQPPETTLAFVAGLKDACGDIRRVASAGWMNAPTISEEAIPALVEALRDPEVQVRSNAAHALSRLDVIPAAAIPLLIECTVDANDGLRMNAANALKLAPARAVIEVMQTLLTDPNSRVRLIAAGSLLAAEPGHMMAREVLVEALEDSVPRVREAAQALLESLGSEGAACSASLNHSNGPAIKASLVSRR
jgi:HEAT repeat protein